MNNPELCVFNNFSVPVYRYNTVIVGSGAAGYNAADSLCALGVRDTAIVTEDVRAGTSRNAGSDKQTYYKLTLGGDEPDSVAMMAKTLFGGGCVDGDVAMCEAALSAECFIKLASLGVPFPKNRYGEWVGYKTDHDPKRRATSAGPYTSRLMTEKLQAAAEAKGVATHDGMLAVKILVCDGKTTGVLCLDLAAAQNGRAAFAAFCCKNIILATGGPAGIYRDTVYPVGQRGANGLAFEAGALGANLTEWQFGLASVNPRWNVSGTYMQALPRFISTDADGDGEREFLTDYYESAGALLTNVFLKGYQWPFDIEKAAGSSSFIDLCVFNETLNGRKVLLDYRSNPFGGDVNFEALGGEARGYLEKAGACFGTPYERLYHMNKPAVDFYGDHGVDLSREPLEIALCAQHNNGGIAVDRWWRTCVEGLFAVGEAAGTHGVRRPGGSALNAGQAGSLRAAQYIAARRAGEPASINAFKTFAGDQINEILSYAARAIDTACAIDEPPVNDAVQSINEIRTIIITHIIDAARERMSRAAGAIRDLSAMRAACEQTVRELIELQKTPPLCRTADLPQLFILRELLVSQSVYLSAFINYIEHGGKSRGSALYSEVNGVAPHAALPDLFKFILDGGSLNEMIQEAEYKPNGTCTFSWRKRRPLPREDDFFENVWRDFRVGKYFDMDDDLFWNEKNQANINRLIDEYESNKSKLIIKTIDELEAMEND